MGPPTGLILALQRGLQIEDFIETGTYRGDTAAWAAGHFPRVVTIELSADYFAAARDRFRSQPGVTVLQGDSGARLREVGPGLRRPALFWLDAHWSGLDTAGRERECPLLEELAIINQAEPTHSVLVDDARLFSAPPPRPHRAEQWPALGDVVDALRAGGRRHVVLFEDVFIGVPSSARDLLTRWVQDELAVQRSGGRLAQWWRRLRG